MTVRYLILIDDSRARLYVELPDRMSIRTINGELEVAVQRGNLLIANQLDAMKNTVLDEINDNHFLNVEFDVLYTSSVKMETLSEVFKRFTPCARYQLMMMEQFPSHDEINIIKVGTRIFGREWWRKK